MLYLVETLKEGCRPLFLLGCLRHLLCVHRRLTCADAAGDFCRLLLVQSIMSVVKGDQPFSLSGEGWTSPFGDNISSDEGILPGGLFGQPTGGGAIIFVPDKVGGSLVGAAQDGGGGVASLLSTVYFAEIICKPKYGLHGSCRDEADKRLCNWFRSLLPQSMVIAVRVDACSNGNRRERVVLVWSRGRATDFVKASLEPHLSGTGSNLSRCDPVLFDGRSFEAVHCCISSLIYDGEEEEYDEGDEGDEGRTEFVDIDAEDYGEDYCWDKLIKPAPMAIDRLELHLLQSDVEHDERSFSIRKDKGRLDLVKASYGLV